MKHKTKNNKTVQTVTLICLVAAAVLLTLLITMRLGVNGSRSEVGSPAPSPSDTVQPVEESPVPTESAMPSPTPTPTPTPESPAPSESGGSQTGTGSAGGSGGGTSSTGSGNNNPKQPEQIQLPYTVPGTNLIVQTVSSYDGIFLEDGSDAEVYGITAIVLKNDGAKPVEYAKLTLNRADGATLEFEATDLLPGATAVVQEKNRAKYQQYGFYGASADTAEVEKLEMSESMIRVEETDSGALKVTNLCGWEIPCVRVFYKLYMADENTYVGGITYVAKLTELEANGSQTIVPSHYTSGYSKVVMVRTYDTTD